MSIELPRRAPIFATLDAMIAMGWGSVTQPEIPDNWREIPREVNQQDLERVRAEELLPAKQRIADIEYSNQRVETLLAERVMANQQERRKRGRPAFKVSEAWMQLASSGRVRRNRVVRGAEMRARRTHG